MLLLNTEQKMKMQCAICQFMGRDNDDLEKIDEEGCCTECFDNFRYIVAERWELGERPSCEQARNKMHI